MDDSVITFDETVDVEETNFNEKNITFKTHNFYILLSFLLTTTAFRTAVNVYCYLIGN